MTDVIPTNNENSRFIVHSVDPIISLLNTEAKAEKAEENLSFHIMAPNDHRHLGTCLGI